MLGRIFACFLKVSFYQIKRVKESNTDKDNQEIYKKHKYRIYHFNCYLREKIFDRLEVHLDDRVIKSNRGEVKITSSIAAYLFETGELDSEDKIKIEKK